MIKLIINSILFTIIRLKYSLNVNDNKMVKRKVLMKSVGTQTIISCKFNINPKRKYRKKKKIEVKPKKINSILVEL